jgi:hypothetical protein
MPRLPASDHRITSQPSDDYNCVGWVRREYDAYIAPGLFWPSDVVREPRLGEPDLDAFVRLFEAWGWERCDGPELEDGFLKIAIYSREGSFQHVAKQLPSGAWSSKMGEAHDLRHAELDSLNDSLFLEYATANVFMKMPYDGVDQYENEERGLILP